MRPVTGRRGHPPYQLAADELVLVQGARRLTDEVGKKEKLQHQEQHEKFHEDDGPQHAAPRHRAEAVTIKTPDVRHGLYHNSYE